MWDRGETNHSPFAAPKALPNKHLATRADRAKG